MTPLMHAVDPEMIHLLIQRGADVNFKTASFYAKTALTHVFSTSYHDQLRKKWASEMTRETESIFLVKRLEDVVSAILEHGANVNELDYCNKPLLNLATIMDFSLSLMRFLIGAGADVDAGSFEGRSALQAAVNKVGSIQKVELLIKEGADVNQTDRQGRSPIFSSNDCEMTEFLIKNGADVNRTDEDGQSPIFMSDDCAVTQCLIKHGADVNVLDKNGNTALICAVKHFFSKELFDLLIRARCSIEHKNNSGKSALGLAMRYQVYDAAEYLLHAGADLNSCLNDANGRTSIDRLLRKMWDDPDSTSHFLHLLLDHKANFSNIIHPCVIHFLIASGCFSLVTKLICSGLGPTDAILQKPVKGWYICEAGVSPLGAALLMKNVELAQYFIDIRYLTKSDIALIFKNDKLFKYLKEDNQLECLKLFKKISQEPFSLETLSFVAVSSAIGSGPGRHDRIRRTKLPVLVQSQMLYKDATPSAKFQDDSDTRSLALFRSFYRNMTGEDYEFCDSDASDSDDFIFYIDEDDLSDSDF
ncbi:unnamed protein product [Lymnaea stagnalis]|uniref:Uncharacterized protein n=1 Tax=Lymnaea stagnalis TaxID=6523 RepID=A0AAV2HSX5_LYMST